MTTIIINADDFGYCEAVNYGIISAHQFGLVRSTTMMANMPGIEHAASLAKLNPGLGCGIHLTLSAGSPVLTTHKTIIDENGNFFKRLTPDVLETFDLEEVYREFRAQIEKIQSLGIELTHFDSHHHVHTLEALKPVIERLLAEYQLPIRGGFEYEMNYGKIVPLMDQFYKEAVEVEFFEKFLETIKSHEVVDLMCHPAFLDAFILGSTSYAIDRTKEHQILTSETVKAYLANNGIKIGNYKSL